MGTVGGTQGSWRRLPVQPKGWAELYEVEFDYSKGLAKISGLILGTEYVFQMSAANGDVKSPWSERVAVKTLGESPANAPALAPVQLPKMPPSNLMVVVDGTTVNLSWTAGENPNYVHQLVRRRVVGVSPLAWTDV